jgi:hypothetical protein
MSPRPVPLTDSSSVAIQFIVDTLGRVELGTLKPLRVRDSSLYRAAVRRMPDWRFMAAVWNGCFVVRQLVQAGVTR